jgi:hypothetical protein
MKLILEMESGDGFTYWTTDYYAFEAEDKDTAGLKLIELVQERLKLNEDYEKQMSEVRERLSPIKVGSNHPKYIEQHMDHVTKLGEVESKFPNYSERQEIDFCGHKLNHRDFVYNGEIKDPEIMTLEEFWERKLA